MVLSVFEDDGGFPGGVFLPGFGFHDDLDPLVSREIHEVTGMVVDFAVFEAQAGSFGIRLAFAAPLATEGGIGWKADPE